METGTLMQAMFSLLFVLGLIGLMALAMRKLNVDQWLKPRARPGSRLAVEESLQIDPRHRLVLLRRDDRLHLVLLGANEQTVIETAISASPKEPGHA